MEQKYKENEEINPLIPILNKHINDLYISQTTVSGFIDGDTAFEQFRNDLAAAGCTYATRSSDKLESKFLFSAKKGDVPVHFFEYPFQVLSVVHYECSQGGTYIPRKTIPEEGDSERKRRKLLQPTKKIGCLAKFVCKKIRVFPDYNVKRNHWMPKKAALKHLRYDLQYRGGIRTFIRYCLSMTPPDSHNHPMKLSSLSLNLNKDLIEKIYELVNLNIVSVKEIKCHLENEVKKMFEGSSNKPDINNSAFFPSEKTIRNHVYKAVFNKSRYKRYTEDGEITPHCELVISMEDEKIDSKASIEKQRMVNGLQEKCHLNLNALTEITYLLQRKSQLESLAGDLKGCIAKHKEHIKRRNQYNQRIEPIIQDPDPINLPSSSSTDSERPRIKVEKIHNEETLQNLKRDSVELLLTVL